MPAKGREIQQAGEGVAEAGDRQAANRGCPRSTDACLRGVGAAAGGDSHHKWRGFAARCCWPQCKRALGLVHACIWRRRTALLRCSRLLRTMLPARCARLLARCGGMGLIRVAVSLLPLHLCHLRGRPCLQLGPHVATLQLHGSRRRLRLLGLGLWCRLRRRLDAGDLPSGTAVLLHQFLDVHLEQERDRGRTPRSLGQLHITERQP